MNYGIRQDYPEKDQHHQPREGRIDKRFSENAHLVDEDKEKHFVCRSCREVDDKKSRTPFYCISCKVGLHPGKCFRHYHTMTS